MAKPERSRRHRGQALRNSLRCLMSLLAIGLLGLLGGLWPPTSQVGCAAGSGLPDLPPG